MVKVEVIVCIYREGALASKYGWFGHIIGRVDLYLVQIWVQLEIHKGTMDRDDK